MLSGLAFALDKIMRRWTPDPFLIAIALTCVVIGAGNWWLAVPVSQMIQFWGDGFWSIMTFTLQMVMVLVGGYIVACSQPVHQLLRRLIRFISTPTQAIVSACIISCLACWLHWGFGLIVAAFTCRQIAQQIPTVNYRLLVATSYSGFLLWHGGLSGSIPLLLATPDNFSQELMRGLVPVSETLGSRPNILAAVGLAVVLPLAAYRMALTCGADEHAPVSAEEDMMDPVVPSCPAEYIEHSRLVGWLIGLFGLSLVVLRIGSGTFRLDLNQLNFLFLFLGILLHGKPYLFLQAVKDSGKKVGPLLLQYPLYGGIMGMMKASGLALALSHLFVEFSTERSLCFWSFLSAGIVNLFVPSGGGQWAVQSTVLIPAAHEIGVLPSRIAVAVAWGDAWTNLAQPFWAVPLLSIAGLQVRDIMGYCLALLLCSGAYLSLVFVLC